MCIPPTVIPIHCITHAHNLQRLILLLHYNILNRYDHIGGQGRGWPSKRYLPADHARPTSRYIPRTATRVSVWLFAHRDAHTRDRAHQNTIYYFILYYCYLLNTGFIVHIMRPYSCDTKYLCTKSIFTTLKQVVVSNKVGIYM